MKQSIAGAWVYGIMITFMMIFIAFIAVTINYGNAYDLKTKIVSTIEKNNGLNQISLNKIDNILKNSSYRIKKRCPVLGEDQMYVGVTDGIVSTYPTDPQNYCVYRTMKAAGGGGDAKYYYTVYLFFDLSLPIFGDIFTFKVNGETGVVYYPSDDYFDN